MDKTARKIKIGVDIAPFPDSQRLHLEAEGSVDDVEGILQDLLKAAESVQGSDPAVQIVTFNKRKISAAIHKDDAAREESRKGESRPMISPDAIRKEREAARAAGTQVFEELHVSPRGADLDEASQRRIEDGR